MEKLSVQEEQVMRCIWQLGPCYVKDILSRYPEPKPPYTTLASAVKNLERKKYVKSQQHGNTYLYTPLVEECEYKRTCTSHIVHQYFENSYKEMVSFFAREQKISASDLEDILRMIEEGKEQSR
ncbi:MAG: BlaI/MecI/CopY family transcriptional regulator [Tannerellaceae bacterium]|jgi:predicted transcriptional regulator|nr:BlaI/MecI/CopY family transcriptional regulator [Tannerellaceae bacterium]